MVSTLASSLPAVHEIGERARRRRHFLLLGLTAALTAVAILAVAIGPAGVSFSAALSSFFGFGDDKQAEIIILAIRLPRLVVGVAAGATLGICGAAMQALFRNPLADPGLIGISSGAAFAVAASIVLGASFAPDLLRHLGSYALPVSAFAGSLLALWAVYLFGRRGGVIDGPQLLLAGIAINAIAGAGVGYLTFISNDQQLRTLTFWTLGSLGGSVWDQVIPAAILAVFSGMMLLPFASPLNAYLLGEREARHLGIDVAKLKRSLIIFTALGVGACVAVTGIIGFIGLVAPHIVRLAAGADHRIVLPGSALLGAILICAGDIIARTAVAPAELPIGLLTSTIGGPFFLWLLLSRRRMPG